jgi:hypothetical protein
MTGCILCPDHAGDNDSPAARRIWQSFEEKWHQLRRRCDLVDAKMSDPRFLGAPVASAALGFYGCAYWHHPDWHKHSNATLRMVFLEILEL